MDKMTVVVSISIACASVDWMRFKNEVMATQLEESLRGHIISIGYAMKIRFPILSESNL